MCVCVREREREREREKLVAIHCSVDHCLERSDLGMELARDGQYLPREVSRWREREP